MPRDTKPSQERESEGNAELEREDGSDDLDDRADEARELERNPMKHDEYQKDVEADMDDLEDTNWDGPDA
jgi:hypothetical protein